MSKYIKKIDVLDKGYVALQDKLGDDLTPVNTARVSYDKKNDTGIMTKGDIGLINFLARENHTSPFRHAILQFEVYAPLMVARQWWKYVTGSTHHDTFMNSWNESSRRYITEEPAFYIPGVNEWRSKPENSKQGSGEPADEEVGRELAKYLMRYIEQAESYYNYAMKLGVAPEQARLFLPAYGMYVRWYWTASLQAVSHFLKERQAFDAQYEIREYANAVKELSNEVFPIALSKLLR